MRHRTHLTSPLHSIERDLLDDDQLPNNKPQKPLNTTGLLVTVYLLLTLGAWINTTRTLPTTVLAAGASYLIYKVTHYPRWPQERPHLFPFLITAIAMLLAAAWMNFATWLVAASDQRKHVYMPLQDNVRIALHAVQEYHPVLRGMFNTTWADTMLFLMILLAMLCSVLFDQLPSHSGFGMASRVLLTIALAFFLRPFFFLSTVLPSALPGCYAARFPAVVPQDLLSFVQVGFAQVRGAGGCNDLVFSGHVVLWTVVPLAWGGFVGGWRTSAVLWVACVHACCKDVLTYQHYSVDFLVGVVITWACWTWAGRWVYTAGHASVGSTVQQTPPVGVVAVVAGVLVLAVGGVALSGA